jgi:hypothetical protein
MCLAPISGIHPQSTHPPKSLAHTPEHANIHPAKGGWHQLAKNQPQWVVKNVPGTDWREAERHGKVDWVGSCFAGWTNLTTLYRPGKWR